ncbi:MAG: fumarate hydratase [Methanobacteriaceae archaeon]
MTNINGTTNVDNVDNFDKVVENTIYEIYKEAVIQLPGHMESLLADARKVEDSEIAQLNIDAILQNIKLAKEKGIPMCQDTGLPILFIKLGTSVNINLAQIKEGIKKGIIKATNEVPLRPNVVDPITRKNTGDNIGTFIPQIDIELVDGNFIEFAILPKGFGSENNNGLKMALPSEGIDGIKEFVIETVKKAGGKPCPPIVVGVGIGGTSDFAMKLAKKSLIREFKEEIRNQLNEDENNLLMALESKLLYAINNLGIGPMGLGGKTTALEVNVLKASTHTAGLPIAVCIQCWANRYSIKRINF